MRTLTDSILLLSCQLAVGSALLAGLSWVRGAPGRAATRRSRRLGAGWARARPLLIRAAGVGMIGGALLLPLHRGRTDPGLLVAGSIAVAGGVLLHGAARLERRGRLRPARSQVRLGGITAAAGVALLLLWLMTSLALAGTLDPASALAVPLLAAAALVALLAGLSAKPRPSCHAATLLYLSGLILLVGAG